MLRRVGIDQDVALDHMKYAGFVESTFPGTNSNVPGKLPTLADAGIDNRPRKRDEEPSPAADWKMEIETRRNEKEPPVPQVATLDIDRELSRLNMKIVSFAEGVPAKARKQIAHELREIASLIEEMP
jgi:hypothetical protein